MRLENKVIVLTGGAGFLGSIMQQRLLEEGAKIAVIDLHISSERKIDDPNVLYFECDVSVRSSLEKTKSEIEDKFGGIEGLVCNAATKSPSFFEDFEKFPLEDWEHVMRVNLTGPMLCAQVFGADMARNQSGNIVNILSIYGIVAPDQRIYEGSFYMGGTINTPAIYSASKAGLWGLTKYLASYWGSKKVRVNAVTPGGIFSGQNDEFVRKYSDRTMLGRMGEPVEIANAVIYLLSDEASYVTGQNLIVDGGLTAW